MNEPNLAAVFPSLPRPSCRVHFISGPPGGGKSTFVAANKAPADRVIDLDEILSELSGLPLYRADKARWLLPAIEERNARLAALAMADPGETVWFIACAPGGAWMWWRRALRPAMVKPCVPTQLECLDRIDRDERRAHDLPAHRAACLDWFKREGEHLRRSMERAARDG